MIGESKNYGTWAAYQKFGIKGHNLGCCGVVSEWSKEHAWKVCIRQRIVGSNPTHSARRSSFFWTVPF